jgi:microcystin-dependent protein
MTGTVLDFAGSAAPSGWMMCYGQAVSRTTYTALFAAIGTTYGAGDGATTFNLPDLRGRIAAGADNMGGAAANRVQASTTATTTNASANITVASAAGLSTGMAAVGAGIPAGATVTAINGTTVTLSANCTAGAAGVAVRFSMLGERAGAGIGWRCADASAERQPDAEPHARREGQWFCRFPGIPCQRGLGWRQHAD